MATAKKYVHRVTCYPTEKDYLCARKKREQSQQKDCLTTKRRMQPHTHTACLPAEWHPQWGVQLTWPHEDTDWQPILDQVTRCYIDMSREIARREHLLVVTPHAQEVQDLLTPHLTPEEMSRVSLWQMPTDDTWARDHGFITLLTPDGQTHLLDFQFNGWGKKFAAAQDNRICRTLMRQHALTGIYEDHLDFVLEGGSIESDGAGTLLTTRQCLMAPNRNQPLTQQQIEQRLKDALHADRVLWLNHGTLAGDDTDGHIDTLARLCPSDTIAYVQCTDTADEHYTELHLMEKELLAMRTTAGKPYHLLPLPMAEAAFDNEGNRLPATYANFLFVNGAILMPTYGTPHTDHLTMSRLQEAFPHLDIIGIDCRPLIIQHGSLHCCTMQIPLSKS